MKEENTKQNKQKEPALFETSELIDELLELPEHADLKKLLDSVGGWRKQQQQHFYPQQDTSKTQ